MRAFSSFFVALAALAQVSVQLPTERDLFNNCPPFSGNITINEYQLYPENADFDFKSCLLYIGALFNATVAVYDPYKNKVVDILEFPGIAHNPLYHIGGVNVDKITGLVSIVVDTANSFNTFGADISGTNFLLQYNPYTKNLDYKLNLTATSHGTYGGFQDIEQDPFGNVYVVGTYPGSILKVDPFGLTVTPWFISQPFVQTRAGLSGLAATGFTLLASDVTNQSLYKFNMLAPHGTPVLVPLTPPTNLTFSDAIYLPPKYNGKVLLIAEDFAGIAVLRSKDGLWNSAEYLGVIPSPVAGGFSTAAVQIGSSLHMVLEFFDTPLPGQASGDRAAFPFPDITKDVEKLLLA